MCCHFLEQGDRPTTQPCPMCRLKTLCIIICCFVQVNLLQQCGSYQLVRSRVTSYPLLVDVVRLSVASIHQSTNCHPELPAGALPCSPLFPLSGLSVDATRAGNDCVPVRWTLQTAAAMILCPVYTCQLEAVDSHADTQFHFHRFPK